MVLTHRGASYVAIDLRNTIFDAQLYHKNMERFTNLRVILGSMTRKFVKRSNFFMFYSHMFDVSHIHGKIKKNWNASRLYVSFLGQ